MGLLRQFNAFQLKLLSELSLSKDFLTHLDQDDDWSFIVKTHSLMEIAISYSLQKNFRSELADVFNKIDMNNKSYGKMVFVRKLGLIEKKLCDFIDLLSEMRNDFVHDIKKIELGIDGYLLQLKSNKSDRYSRWVETLGASLPAQIQMRDNIIPREEFVVTIARSIILTFAMDTLMSIYMQTSKRLSDREWELRLIRLGEEQLGLHDNT